MIRVPRRLGLLLIGIGGLFGMRTPPDPEAIARMAPPPDTGGAGRRPEANMGAIVELPRDLEYSRARQRSRQVRPPEK